MIRALVVGLLMMCAAPSPAYAAQERRAIALTTVDGDVKIVAIAASEESCKGLVSRLHIGAKAPPADPFTFACVVLPVKA